MNPVSPGSSTRATVEQEPSDCLVLGVIIPCRNEANVIERKLRNLAQAIWPVSEKPHQVVVVDDGSTDGTADKARSACARLFADASDAAARVVAHSGPPGKAGAIQTGVSELERDEVDLIVLTDADVVFRPEALPAVGRAFREHPALGMACGRQEFVRDLAADGCCDGADGRSPVRADEPYDLWTARVRRCESRHGLLFSVHGQLLAWRAELELSPTAGIAADDLDLMFQVRERGRRVELLPDAAFLEVKPPHGTARDEQQLRRARAYIQVMAGRRPRSGAGLGERIQLLAYRVGPTLLPSAVLPAFALLGVGTFLAWSLPVDGPHGPGLTLMRWLLSAALLAGLALIASPVGRHVRQLFGVIRAAQRAETAGTLTDRWDRVAR